MTVIDLSFAREVRSVAVGLVGILSETNEWTGKIASENSVRIFALIHCPLLQTISQEPLIDSKTCTYAIVMQEIGA